MCEWSTTIAAISTPPGKGGVAVIRLSGSEALTIAERVFRPRGKRTLREAPRIALYGDFLENGKAIDDGLALSFPAPSSYTGEDTVEFSCHGGVLITRTVLEALFVAGAVPAAPGEFTRRAYLSGKLGLTEAEAIASLLDARSMAQVQMAAARGLLSEGLDKAFREGLSLVSAAEAVIDFPDEDLSELSPEEFEARLSTLYQKIKSLADTYRTGRAISEGVRATIVGRPNVGKSSLYNLLLGEEAAIVSEYEGTTRDILEKTVPVGRVLLRLSDTAGLRKTEDPVERIGVERARSAMRDADLLLLVFDASHPLSEEERELLREDKGDALRIAVLNKCDLKETIEADEIERHVKHIVRLSAKAGELAPLTSLIEVLFTDGELRIGEAPIVASARQYASLCRAADALLSALNGHRDGSPTDMVLFELTEALKALGEVDGRTVNEAVVQEIFSHFCVGK